MKRFAFHGVDHTDAQSLRAEYRQAHVDYQHHRGNPVGGPLLDNEGIPCGTLVVFDASDIDAARAIMAADPYVAAGLFASIHIHEFNAIDWPG